MPPASNSIVGHADETRTMSVSSIAALSLLAANAGMLFIYFALDLTLFQLVFVYWFEALWIGLFSGLKLLVASVFGDPYENRWVGFSRGASFLMSLFAIAKADAAFLILLMISGVALIAAQQELTGTDGSDFIHANLGLMLKCSLMFMTGHGLSFIINFVVLGEFRSARFGTLLWLPFKRALALFVTIAASLTAIQAYPGVFNDTAFAALLIAVKLAWDYYLHRRERRSLAPADATGEPQ